MPCSTAQVKDAAPGSECTQNHTVQRWQNFNSHIPPVRVIESSQTIVSGRNIQWNYLIVACHLAIVAAIQCSFNIAGL